MAEITTESRTLTAFLCLAVTDALGAPLEFGPRKDDPRTQVSSILPNKNFGLPPGHFTDDTSMALALALSLIGNDGETNVISQAQAYIQWYRHGWMSSVPGKCFDIGCQTRQALQVWEECINPGDHGTPGCGSEILKRIREDFSGERNCGNGSLMRVLPCILISCDEPEAIMLARESSMVTHPHPRCMDACAIYASLVYLALSGESKETLVKRLSKWFEGWNLETTDKVLSKRLEKYKSCQTFIDTPASSISSSGYVVDTLEAALWAFFSTSTYEEGAIRVVNLGDDADTVGAVYGGLAGAFYGKEEIIPSAWLSEMKGLKIVRCMAGRITKLVEAEC